MTVAELREQILKNVNAYKSQELNDFTYWLIDSTPPFTDMGTTLADDLAKVTDERLEQLWAQWIVEQGL